ncbi:MAG: hypothetical protein IJB75_03005 [Oscillospiraceae bacterium]|nr:hypothetical protein [Oscillospiraceae bacterium]
MNAWLLTARGQRWALPAMLEWEMDYGCATPCDSFRVVCLWNAGQESVLADAVRFEACQGGQTVFVGVVDECVVTSSPAGSRLEISGRGLAALLLDNEAQSVEYAVATQEDILREHVFPYGIEVAQQPALPAVRGFSVSTGSSEWSVLYQFARFYGGVTPRFDREGKLVLTGWNETATRKIDRRTAVSAITLRHRRYGVLSEVWVRDRGGSAKVEKVVNQTFKDGGGQSRRVFTMPEKSDYQAMRYQGQYQLECSRQRQVELEVELPVPFAAWPGELVEIEGKGQGIDGRWRVARSVVSMDESGYRTCLELLPPDVTL